MPKPRTGTPRFLFCSNPLVNDLGFILHTTKPRCLLKVIKEGRIACRVDQLYDEASQEELAEIEKESLKRYFFFIKNQQGTNWGEQR